MSGGNIHTALHSLALEAMLGDGDLLGVEVLGVEFAVRWGREVTREQRDAMRWAWARCASSRGPLSPPLPMEPTDGEPFSASVTHQPRAKDVRTFTLQAATFEELAENLTSRLTVAAILANAGELMMLHACGVADPVTGAVVALVAKSGTGKTTAASVLARTYGYVTDETVAIGPDGSVIPYPKPLSVKQGSGIPKRQVGPDEFGLEPAPVNPFIQSIVLLDRVRSDRPVTPVLQRVPLADAVLSLIPDSSSQGEIEEPLQSLCRLIDSVGGVWQVTYSEAADLPAALKPMFRTQPGTQSEWEPRVVAGTQSGHIPNGCVRRAIPKDAVAIGGDLLVMLDNEIVRVSGIGPAIWEASANPVRLDQLAEEVGNMHGRPEGYRDAVAAAAEQLIAKSVLDQGRT
ncbi:hypothetical protein [Arthrobacter sp. ZGTC412]|uniref:hypothetical protein n=1 Tax=Arthrobacter sp. ZGTC412 TaxID=2058900 RepID=UPI00215789C5|nr:hypothetical protein [Arthrobacter sp. ZGTC412]